MDTSGHFVCEGAIFLFSKIRRSNFLAVLRFDSLSCLFIEMAAELWGESMGSDVNFSFFAVIAFEELTVFDISNLGSTEYSTFDSF